jgi:hypothetical protein
MLPIAKQEIMKPGNEKLPGFVFFKCKEPAQAMARAGYNRFPAFDYITNFPPQVFLVSSFRSPRWA